MPQEAGLLEHPGAVETDYTYDAVGNRETMVTGAGTTNYTYDAADRLTLVDPPGAGSTSYTFDDNGNLTDRGSDAFDWDAQDRLISATVSSVTTTFTYNGDGLRESLTVNSNTTTFTWDVNRSIPQVLDDEDLRYVYGIGRIAQVDGADTFYYLTDGLGSTMALTDADGDVVNDYDYDVFGALRDSSGSQGNDFTFAGEQVDESTELQYLRARYYDAASGRLISKDPLSKTAAWVGHPFAYVDGNPVLFADPWGLCKLKLSWSNAKDCVEDAGQAVVGAGETVGGVISDTFGPPYDIAKVITILDVLPSEAGCAVAAGAVGLVALGPYGAAIFGAVAYGACEAVIGVVGFANALNTILDSDCSNEVKAAAIALNIVGLGADVPAIPFEIAEVAVEAGVATATTALLQSCGKE